MIKYYDIGLNLFCKQFRDPDAIIADAAENGVYCILTGSDMESDEKIAEYVASRDCLGTCGVHPHSADSASEKDFLRIREIVSGNERIVAVGECGLDYDRMFSAKENQLRCFEEHIRIAEELGKPMFLHERDAINDFAERFKGREELCGRSVVHCFTGDRGALKKYLDMGFYIGITGWLCDERRGGELRDAVRYLPSDRVMIETDAPYLTPRNVKGLGRTNLPRNVKYVAEELAARMGIPAEKLVPILAANTRRFFGIADSVE